MKLLTLNFLTCAVKRCKDSAVAPSDPTTTSTTSTPPHDPTEDPTAPSRKTGKAFPLQIHSAELTRTETTFNPQFLRNVLPRCEWWALREVAASVGLEIPGVIPVALGGDGVSSGGEGDGMDVDGPREVGAVGAGGGMSEEEEEKLLRTLHEILIQTEVESGRLVCGNCGHEYRVLEGIPNFLLPPHLL